MGTTVTEYIQIETANIFIKNKIKRLCLPGDTRYRNHYNNYLREFLFLKNVEH